MLKWFPELKITLHLHLLLQGKEYKWTTGWRGTQGRSRRVLMQEPLFHGVGCTTLPTCGCIHQPRSSSNLSAQEFLSWTVFSLPLSRNWGMGLKVPIFPVNKTPPNPLSFLLFSRRFTHHNSLKVFKTGSLVLKLKVPCHRSPSFLGKLRRLVTLPRDHWSSPGKWRPGTLSCPSQLFIYLATSYPVLLLWAGGLLGRC